VLPDDEGNPHEPDLPDPDAMGPRVETTEPDVPEPEIPDIEDVDVPQELFVAFWTVVAMANIALFGVTVGALVIVAFGEWLLGAGGIGVGVAAGLVGYRRYEGYRNR
jgi:hypothetical protein